MEETWASGALELLKHADAHIGLESAFDKRIAFVSIDNSVETSIRTYLSLPKQISGFKITKKILEDAEYSFPKLNALLFQHASSKLTGLEEHDIEHYHRIRNTLYHDGTGLSVDERYLLAYRQIAAVLLNNLFGVAVPEQTEEPSLENLILLWNKIESSIRHSLKEKGINLRHTYKWELAAQAGILTMDEVIELQELRMLRNSQVHSTKDEIDRDKIALGVKLANKLLSKFKS